MSIVSRVTNIALRPKEEWPVIAAETTTTAGLYTGFIVPLLLIGPLCSFLSALVFGQRIPFTGVAVRPAAGTLIAMLVVSFVLGLIAIALTAFIVQKLAPTFQSQGTFTQSLQLVAYSEAPFWVSGVLYLIPFLGVLTIFVALYGLYLAYLGLPVMMKTPADKVIPYLVVVIVVTVILWFLVAAVSGAIIGASLMVSSIS
ncbi:MAG: Yip1 family protein [Candidatus Zixiibacteriota bacterium]